MNWKKRHWGNSYIGMSYVQCGGCWGFVRMVFADQLGIEMQSVATGLAEEAQYSAIKAASKASGWRPAPLPPGEHDILLMRAPDGRRHVGVVVHANGSLGLLHCTETGGPSFVRLMDLARQGYSDIEVWRRR